MKHRFFVKAMSCPACERHVERALMGVSGVTFARANHATGAVVLDAGAGYDGTAAREALALAGYPVDDAPRAPWRRMLLGAGLVCALAALYWRFGPALAAMLPMPGRGMTLPALFVLGLSTSLHCALMCGGIPLSVCGAGDGASLRPAFLYNTGRVLGYVLVGAIVGLIGRALAPSFTLRGALMLFSALFMFIMGLNLLGLLGFARRLMPRLGLRLPAPLARALASLRAGGPLLVGFLNALMPCGPLQAMQLYALGTGSAMLGALSMGAFALGTVPLMLAIGAFASLRRFSGALRLASGITVLLLAALMAQSGIALLG